MTAARTRDEERLIAEIKLAYEEHDRLEAKLVAATRMNQPTGLLWRDHDALERRIVGLEAKLPQPLVEKLKAGEV